jgi:hypothetical protein
MGKAERMREILHGPIDLQKIQDRADAGWRPVAIEWEREGESSVAAARSFEVPFGLQVDDDCQRLKENAEETETLVQMMKLIIQEISYDQVADELNKQGHRTRQGGRWSPVSVYYMLPRLIEVGPRIFPTDQWAEIKRQLMFSHS